MKKVLFITHQLTRTGAPIVMMDAVRILKEEGCDVHMISMGEGELREEVEALGIEITIRGEFMEDAKGFLESVWDYDLVFVNTIVPLQTIHLLNLAHMPVIWWIHEPEVYFDVYGQWLPDFKELKPHIHIWAVSPVVKELIKRRCGVDAELVPFGIPDAAGEISDTTEDGSDETPVTFLTIGVYCKRKGQDLLHRAIESLPERAQKKCRFLFCGNQVDVEPDVYEPLEAFAEETENVELLPYMPHDEMLKAIRKADYLLIPSRQEPMPTVAAEGMMLSVPSVISDACGIARYLSHGKNGLIFKSDNKKTLCAAIEKAVSIRTEQPENYCTICENARAIYEKEFSMEGFREKLMGVLM